MKRLNSSDSLLALMSTCPTSEELSPRNSHFCNLQPMLDGLDEEGCIEEYGHIAEKKKRLSLEQVKALEKTFEDENKLEPERKVKLAQELGLQPRQVAVWFQNRRARWKTKQLERDYGLLKANYEALKLNCESLQRDNEILVNEIRELKAKLQEDNSESDLSMKEEMIITESDKPSMEQNKPTPDASVPQSVSEDLNYESFKNEIEPSFFPDFKDGSSDSDSSAILNEDNSPKDAVSSSGKLQNHSLLISPPPPSLRLNCFSSSSPPSTQTCFQIQKGYQPQQFVKMEEHNFFGGEDTCNFFSDEQAPSLHWYCPDQWNL